MREEAFATSWLETAGLGHTWALTAIVMCALFLFLNCKSVGARRKGRRPASQLHSARGRGWPVRLKAGTLDASLIMQTPARQTLTYILPMDI
jgi:hypothetical protein